MRDQRLVEPILGVASMVVGLAILLFALNILVNAREVAATSTK